MLYNAHTIMKEYYTMEQLTWMPQKNFFDKLNFYIPKMKEIQRRQEKAQLEAELGGETKGRPPGR